VIIADLHSSTVAAYPRQPSAALSQALRAESTESPRPRPMGFVKTQLRKDLFWRVAPVDTGKGDI
jgi:hypothetical protein